ncbi:MAG: protein translocase subunit SecD [Chlamydiales bacterium]
MEKRKWWQLCLILGVIVLAVYNILPTIFYYSNPLKKPINEKEAGKVAQAIIHRVNSLEGFTLSWLKAQSKNLGLKPLEISIDPEDPRLAKVVFQKPKEAALFSKTLIRAGALIPFVPAQLSPASSAFDQASTTVTVQRRIGVHFNPDKAATYFHFVPKVIEGGEVSLEYRELINDRLIQLAESFGGTSEPATVLSQIAKGQSPDEAVIRLARNIVEYENAFGDHSPITQRYFASFTQISTPEENHSDLVHAFIGKLEQISGKLNNQITAIKEEQSRLQKEGELLDVGQQQQLGVYESQKNSVDAAATIIRRNTALFEKGHSPLKKEDLLKTLTEAPIPESKVQTLELGNRNPFVDKLEVDWNKDTFRIILYPDINALREQKAETELEAIQIEKLNQLIFAEIAAASRNADETITPSLSNFEVALNNLTNSSSLLLLDIGAVADMQTETLSHLLTTEWQPSEGEFSQENYPIYDYSTFKNLPLEEQKLGIFIFAPATESEEHEDFRKGSIYIVARGLNTIREKYENLPQSPEKETFEKQFRSLQELLRQNDFIGYPAAISDLPAAYKDDYIFELDNYYSYLIAATRENFSVKGSKQYAVLEFTDVEQRLLTLNKIETQTHEDLLKWHDEYRQAKVSVDPNMRLTIPKPTQNALWNNLKLSFAKYFRGDERKILKWGLDLSGGKTVRIGLRDQSNQAITNEDDLKQAVNELYQRVNRLGVSEVGIRIEGPTIVLDFPGQQGMTASDLIQASAMYFHVVNEKFTPNNPTLAEAINIFLEEVWNEAVITSRTDITSINEIAWQHLGGDPENPEEFNPLSAHARLLYEHGLRFAPPKGAPPASSAFDDSLSAVAHYRGSDISEWQGQTYPLLIVFRNWALEGVNLTDVQTGYDPSEGNILNFGVKSSFVSREGQRINPRDDFYSWTSQFSEEKIAGTPNEAFSKGQGWRMAVILNDSIINAPTLTQPLRDRARITGHFSQREINQLAADLKAGSLSFTPRILSEQNISPDLGKAQRTQAIIAVVLGVSLVFVLMCSYYRFSGLIACIAVLFNLLIIWAALQNLDAALTLPGIAGIILAIGMSVDANVLVFERIREEFAISKRLPSAVQSGYRKAFSAIMDSNLTTIIAALILLNFDSGPIKGFALTLIIGIVSSMFTALFMTRFFFAGWVQNPKHNTLNMARLFGQTKFNFLSRAKIAFIVAAVAILVGGFFLVKERQNIFGMDFTGGYALTLDLQERANTDYRTEALNALVNAGASPSDLQIQELNKPNQLRIQLGIGMEQSGEPFYQIDQKPAVDNPLFSYESYPRIVWILEALEKQGLEINPASLPELDLHWTEMSGQLSDTMRNQAMLGLGLALLAILIYITFRFEFKYAISATIALASDLLVTLGVLAIVHIFYEGVQIDLQVIAALMTIVGYSLNDTIIIFDRIREDIRVLRKTSFPEVINHALNTTLSRTVMTSTTTLLVLLALLFFGGASIINFSLIMTLGIIIGTFSSLYIAAPLLLYFHKREESKALTSTKQV